VAGRLGEVEHELESPNIITFGYLGKQRKATEEAVAMLESMAHKTRPVVESGDASKVCPECAETVKAAARVCRFCGNRFAE
jgi:hypothetical protein